jgi:hypothetical protein
MRKNKESFTKQAYRSAKEIVEFKLRDVLDGSEYHKRFDEMIEEEYHKRVLMLPTSDLDAIVHEHHSGYIRKDEELIEKIVNELSERIILGGDYG